MSWELIRDMNSIPETCSTHKCSMYWEGDWFCPECQKEEHSLMMDAEAQWYSESALCQKCGNAWGPDSGDKCSEYNMPLYMTKRKYRCKHYKEWIEPPEHIPTSEEIYQEELWYFFDALSDTFRRFRWIMFRKFDPFIRYADVFKRRGS